MSRGRGRHRLERTGTEPITAYSDIRLRILLSAIFTPLFAGATVAFAIWLGASGSDSSPGRGPLIALTVGCAILTLAAATDLAILLRRRREARDERDRDRDETP
ncbi:hypothetical protein E1265_15495 [Streptomyces sp. 8K308]|uniref:DUF6343 family protein n=1 Tax=Streptomyces sp. 8K308 TaxID=2530388 RepID=UPI001048A6F6|nr:DUF6343 family protein [Streptomyces sp. 8K308]TDC22554.1 hypothetical protein E1265_15495 [Streptomyces sp. 8K308]